MEEEVLRALPAALDDDALAALITIPREDRSLLQRTLQQMADIYGPPSNTRHRFAARRKGVSETLLAFRSASLALAMATFPRVDYEGIDALVFKKMALARDLRVVIYSIDDGDLCSLGTKKCIQAHYLLQRQMGLDACTVLADSCSSSEEPQPNLCIDSSRGLESR
ncbi:unnamed protein product [Lampetra fluviatilis]